MLIAISESSTRLGEKQSITISLTSMTSSSHIYVMWTLKRNSLPVNFYISTIQTHSYIKRQFVQSAQILPGCIPHWCVLVSDVLVNELMLCSSVKVGN